MARQLFGGRAEDFLYTVQSATGLMVAGPGVSVTFWSAQSGGSQVTDLTDLAGNPVTSVVTNAAGMVPQFYGPDSAGSQAASVAQLWASSAGGPRVLLQGQFAADPVPAIPGMRTLGFGAQQAVAGSALRDTGWRNVDALNAYPGAEPSRLRRIGSIVYANAELLAPTPTISPVPTITIPAGFQVGFLAYMPRSYINNAVLINGEVIDFYFVTAGAYDRAFLTWPTDDAWPATLPGTLITPQNY